MNIFKSARKFAGAAALAIGAAAVGAALVYQPRVNATDQAPSAPLVQQAVPPRAAAAPALALPDIAGMVEKVGDAVVNIQVTGKTPVRADETNDFEQFGPFGEFMRRFGTPLQPFQAPEPTHGIGSGFIISGDGYIVTNNHVIDHADQITVKLGDKREFGAKVIGRDALTDVALLKIKAQGLPSAKIGNSDSLRVGQWVVAIGAPFGFDRTATQGIVSALHRSLPNETYVPFIQTDVAVNPGNSGGPLLDLAGNVVGINSQIYSRSGGYMGLSFAIPANVAMNVVDQLKATGRVERGWLGVALQEVTHDLAQSFNLDKPRGALVSSVNRDSPAAQGGIKAGDVIVDWDGHAIVDSGDLPPLVGSSKSGKRVSVNVIRDGKQRQLEVTVGKYPDNGQAELAEAGGDSSGAAQLNILVTDLSPEQRKELGVREGGVLVNQVQPGAAADAGVQPGDVLLQLNGKPVRNVASLRQLVKHMPSNRSVSLLVKRNDATLFLALRTGSGGPG
jgi:serine protease Do